MRVLLPLFVLLPWLVPAQNTGRRLALLVGNQRYQSLEPIAAAPANVATLAESLRQTGFADVRVVENCTLAMFQAEREQLVKKIQPGDSVVVYFSGYGVAASDEYYLLPTGFNPAGDISNQAILLSTLVQALEDRRPAFTLVVLESAFRAPALGKFIDANPAPAEPRSTTVWFADQWTAAGLPAATPGPAPFTREIAKVMVKPGASPPVMFDEARNAAGSAKAFGPNGSRFFFKELPPVVITKEVPKEIIREVPGQAKPSNKRTYKPDRVTYVKIPAGKFLMGCVPGGEKDCESAEQPQHPVELTRSYWMAETEVDVSSYRRYIESDKKLKMPGAPARNSKWATANRPMVVVSWEQASAYCAWLGGRLPTEAEWERAARGGVDGAIFPMKTMAEARDKANFRGKQGNDTWDDEDAPVKKFDPNAYGLYDMSGNVWEWVSDYYAEGYYGELAAGVKDPPGPGSGKEHVIRGGSFSSDPAVHLRLSYRKSEKGGVVNVGFRCVLPDTAEVLGKMVEER